MENNDTNHQAACEIIGERMVEMLNDAKLPPNYAITCTGSTFVSAVCTVLGQPIADGLMEVIKNYLKSNTEDHR